MKKRYLVSPIGRGTIPAGIVSKNRITAPTEVEMEESRVAKVRKFGKVVELAESRVVKVSKFGKVAELVDEENKKVINEEPIVKTVDDNVDSVESINEDEKVEEVVNAEKVVGQEEPVQEVKEHEDNSSQVIDEGTVETPVVEDTSAETNIETAKDTADDKPKSSSNRKKTTIKK